MKVNDSLLSAWRWPTLGVLIFALNALDAFPQLAQPIISSVKQEGTNLEITVRVPPGLRRVTLECRERLGPGSWEPRAVGRLDGSGGLVRLRVARSRALEMMRIRADASDPLPASFYTGTNAFFEQASSAAGPGAVAGDFATPGGINANGSSSSTREVVESDIWKSRGKTLYFFNQLRGLQVIDLNDPDKPTVLSTLEMPAAGEDLYLLGANHIALLTHNGCGGDQSEIVIIAETNGIATVVTKLKVSGSIQESRLVGTALYVASQSVRPVPGSTNTSWEWGTLVSSFDLAEPAQPAARGALWYSGYGNVISATDRLLFVVTQDPANWWQSIIHVVDITAPDGSMGDYDTIRSAGRVPDKFKLNWNGGVFTSISEDWRSTSTRRVTTKLETFRLSDPAAASPQRAVKLGELELGAGEQLHASRFDGQLVYVVTFFRIDPLWVVSLATPSAPRIVGSVDVPGWSTFIQPLGDRLVTIGVETNKVAVSLFDVGNPAAPAQLSRVRLGNNYSWSEANWDEKAFSVLPEAGLILVPYSGDTTNGYASRVQLVDLNRSSLAARGVIEHQLEPRRATLYQDRVLSISGWELLSVDVTDRDHPLVRSDLTLAWPVDRLFVEGNFLLEIGSTVGWGGWQDQSSPVLRVVSTASPDVVLNSVSLTNLPVLGATTRDGRLYLAQGQQGWFWPLPLADAGGENDPITSKLLLTIIALDQLPALRVLGQTAAETGMPAFGADLQPVWPKPGTLVWAGGGFNFWWWGLAPMAVDAGFAFGPIWFPWWGGGGGGGHLLAFDVSNPGAPAFASQVDLTASNWWSFSKAFAAEGMVYLSHQTSEFVPQIVDPVQPLQGGVDSPPGGEIQPAGMWLSRSYLDVVDYGDARHPLVRKPVNIPGTLNGVSHQGAVLYTVGMRWTTNSQLAGTEYLDASAYDGVEAHLIDSLPLPQTWPRPLLVLDTNIFLGRASSTSGGVVFPGPGGVAPAGAADNTGNTNSSLLETWYLSDQGKLTQSGRVSLAAPASTLNAFESLLAAQQTDNTVLLFDASNGAALRQIGQGQPSGCFWFDLSRADGDLLNGLWVPLGAYGAVNIRAGQR